MKLRDGLDNCQPEAQSTSHFRPRLIDAIKNDRRRAADARKGSAAGIDNIHLNNAIRQAG